MCVSFQTVTSHQLSHHFDASLAGNADWNPEVWQDYAAPIIVGDERGRQALLGQYSLIPKKQIPAGAKRFSTMNARAETIANLRSFAQPWRDGQLCLVPMMGFYESGYEAGKAERWRIGMIDAAPFAVAGLWRSWVEPDEATSYSFTQITINADAHPLMKRFQKPGDEKRSLVILPPDSYDDWLGCRSPAQATTFLANYAPELMRATLVPKVAPIAGNLDLF